MIVTGGSRGVRAAMDATTTISIVIVSEGDVVDAGFVANLARPGGKLTGQTFFSPELMAKRLELLKEAIPHFTRVGVFLNPTNPLNRVALAPPGLIGVVVVGCHAVTQHKQDLSYLPVCAPIRTTRYSIPTVPAFSKTRVPFSASPSLKPTRNPMNIK